MAQCMNGTAVHSRHAEPGEESGRAHRITHLRTAPCLWIPDLVRDDVLGLAQCIAVILRHAKDLCMNDSVPHPRHAEPGEESGRTQCANKELHHAWDHQVRDDVILIPSTLTSC